MSSNVTIDGRRLQITREFAAPAHLVFPWWANGDKLKQWSGCKDCVRCEVEMDFRVGGGFTQTMQIKDICEFVIIGAYVEIVDNERIVYDGVFGTDEVRVTVEFRESAGRTTVVVTYDGCPNEFFSQNVSGGTSDSLEALDKLLAGSLHNARG